MGARYKSPDSQPGATCLTRPVVATTPKIKIHYLDLHVSRHERTSRSSNSRWCSSSSSSSSSSTLYNLASPLPGRGKSYHLIFIRQVDSDSH